MSFPTKVCEEKVWCQGHDPITPYVPAFKPGTRSEFWPAHIGVRKVLKSLIAWPGKALPSHLLQAGPMHFEVRHAGSSPGAGQNPAWDRAVDDRGYRWTAKGDSHQDSQVDQSVGGE